MVSILRRLCVCIVTRQDFNSRRTEVSFSSPDRMIGKGVNGLEAKEVSQRGAWLLLTLRYFLPGNVGRFTMEQLP